MIPTTTTTSLIFLLLLHLTGCHRPPKAGKPPPVTPPGKLDIGFIMDISAATSRANFDRAVKLMRQFANHVSVSSGTSRFALLSINTTGKVQEHFLFNQIVNRECLLREIRKFSHTYMRIFTTYSFDFGVSLRRGLKILRSGSNQVLDQRSVYFLLTDSPSRLDAAVKEGGEEGGKEGTDSSSSFELYTVLLGDQKAAAMKNSSASIFR